MNLFRKPSVRIASAVAVAALLLGASGVSAQAATAVTWDWSMITPALTQVTAIASVSETQGFVLTAADLRADYPSLTDTQWASLTATVTTNGVGGPGTTQTDSSGNFVSYTLPPSCGTRNWAAFITLTGPWASGPGEVGLLHIFENDAVCSYRVPVAASFTAQTSTVTGTDLLKLAGAGRIDPAFPGVPTYFADVWPVLSLTDSSTWTFTAVNTHPQVRLLTATPGAVVATDTAGDITSISPTTPSTSYTVTYSLSTATGLYPTTDGTITYSPDGTVTSAPVVPTITSLEPDHGPTEGGNNVSISGTNLDPTCTVTFDGIPVVITGSLDTLLHVTAPAHVAGMVDVVVTCNGVATAPLSYTYDTPAPVPPVSSDPTPPVVAVSPPAPVSPPATAPKLPVVSG